MARRFPGLSVGLAVLSACLGAGILPHVDAQTVDVVAQARQALDADKIDDAIALLERAVAANPGDPAALAWLGNARVRKARSAPLMDRPGWVQKGFNTLDEAVERFPDAFVVYVVRGTTAVAVPAMFNKATVAIDDLRRVLAMKERRADAVPDVVMPGVYLNLGLAYKKNRQPDEARATWEKARNAYPSAPETREIQKELEQL